MPKTLREVCDFLIKCGHQYVWLDWRSWSPNPRPSHLNEQPFVTSCSGRELAEYDGATWYFINCTEYLLFNAIDDFDNPLTTKHAYLTDEDIDNHRIFSGL